MLCLLGGSPGRVVEGYPRGRSRRRACDGARGAAARPGRRAVNVGERLLRGYSAVRMASRASCGRAA